MKFGCGSAFLLTTLGTSDGGWLCRAGIEDWSPTSVQQRLIKTGERLVNLRAHAGISQRKDRHGARPR
jgi:hypothetical protein